MTDPIPDEPLDVTKVDEPRVAPRGPGSPHYIDPETGYFGFQRMRHARSHVKLAGNLDEVICRLFHGV